MTNSAHPDQLIWIYTVCKGKTYPGSAGLGLICAPSFEEVRRAYCFGFIRPSVRSSVCHAFLVSKISKEPLKLGSWNFATSLKPMTWLNWSELWTFVSVMRFRSNGNIKIMGVDIKARNEILFSSLLYCFLTISSWFKTTYWSNNKQRTVGRQKPIKFVKILQFGIHCWTDYGFSRW